ncbi:Elongator subunit elp2 [Coemansia spiralis]|uniref:Elongator complex protein 2 n=2 Tax=Coemansia TaxID=4863 RepID=A0A9W8L0I4_9FUNG|nr:Elongator subunit elp2 [Coemansia umbellata]KAJ2623199.1 Elongator subunit elp2 [Coemansia sp. RSA 1358]KAJ2680076.1 Elongator subunit elp2 [Coemansia spiralis]
MVKAATEFISSACNRTAHALDWLGESLIAFGAGNFVALYNPADPKNRGIYTTLQGHSKRVNCAQFARDAAGLPVDILVSASADCTARVWAPIDTEQIQIAENRLWKCAAVLTGHSDPIIALATIDLRQQDLAVTVTAGTDGTLRVYEYSRQQLAKEEQGDIPQLTPVQTIDVGSRNALDVALSVLPAGTANNSGGSCAILLATGNTDNRVHLYARESSCNAQFAKSLSLSGHEDWVTTLAFLSFQPQSAVAAAACSQNATISHWQAGNVILASGSEDKYVRLWRIYLVNSSSNSSSMDSKHNDESMLLSAERSQDDDKKAAQAVLDALTDSLRTGASITDAAMGAMSESSLVQGGEVKGGSNLAVSQLSTRAHLITATVGESQNVYAVSLDSVLIGHDGWVHSVAWSQSQQSDGENGPLLVTASGDSSVMVWTPDRDAGVWSSVARLGEVGGAVLGFLGAAMDPAGTSICAHGYHGSFHMWRLKTKPLSAAGDNSASSATTWIPEPSPSGHFGSVQDVCWDPHGNYLLSVSTDQTARLYAPWIKLKQNESSTEQRIFKGWHEIARPQIHGYDMRNAAFISAFQYISGADEKVVRVFQATQQFVSSWRLLAGITDLPSSADSESKKLAVGASLPVLGLSNKAVEETQVQALLAAKAEGNKENLNDTYQVRQTHTDVVANATIARAQNAQREGADQNESPPLEEDLLRHTLWPEADKLYGHPYEIFSIATAYAGDWVATACKATSERFAGIRLYSTRTWQPPTVRRKPSDLVEPPDATTTVTTTAAPLLAHGLTITRLRFSPPTQTPSGIVSDRYILSVSRDRSWALYERTLADSGQLAQLDSADGIEVYDEPTGPYCLVHRQQKAHARIIWDSAWAPDGRFFATASRDKTVKLWSTPAADQNDLEERNTVNTASKKPIALAFPEAVTAIDFLPALILDGDSYQYVLAAALESGRMFVLVGSADACTGSSIPTAWKPAEVPRFETHVAMVQRLSWRPRPELGLQTTTRSWQLASGSDDQSVRIITVDF